MRVYALSCLKFLRKQQSHLIWIFIFNSLLWSSMRSISWPTLDSQFGRASTLYGVRGNIIPKPGALDRSLILATTSNKVHIVKPGKDNSLSWDRTCVNFSTKIWEQILTVAQVKGCLKSFYLGSKKEKRKPWWWTGWANWFKVYWERVIHQRGRMTKLRQSRNMRRLVGQ